MLAVETFSFWTHRGHKPGLNPAAQQSPGRCAILGWGIGNNGRHFYVRQLRDMKTSAIVEDFNAAELRAYRRVCGWAIARAHARSGDGCHDRGLHRLQRDL
jgi:hypothetical protein